LHKFVHESLCLLLTYLAYMRMISSSSQIQDHPSKLCQGTAAQPPTSMCCWWALLKEHHPTAPPPQHHFTTDQCLSEYISSSSQNLLSWISCSSTSYFLFWIAQGVTQWLMVGGSSLSLSLFSLTHTVNFFSSYEWMNEARESVIHFCSTQSEEY
jgi:hypothetical protein